MDYKRINNIAGWGTFLTALVVYLLTMSPTASFWDCGEFIACSNELEVPHPPGAPFFLLLGRLFAFFAGPESVAFMVNLLSVLSSAFTVLFTFWITTHLGRKIMVGRDGKPNTSQIIAIIGAGLVAGLANTFADSFWFNAVEAEVYAMSSFFTAIVVWLMFKWENYADNPGSERWIILIAYLMGLSIGVHLLNLLTIPALAFIYYFRKYDFSWKGFLSTGAISIAILGVVQTGIIVWTFDLAWLFESVFAGVIEKRGAETGLGLPIGTGVILFFTLLFGGLAFGVYYSQVKRKLLLNTALLSTVVVYIGFASYLMIPIRSNANPPIDENNPDNTLTFLSYMKREQYGDRPLLKGPLYNAQPTGLDNNGTEYVLEEGKDRYTVLGEKRKYKYNPKDLKLFPRMYDGARWDEKRFGEHAYRNYVSRKGKSQYEDRPTASEDLRYFFNYQINHMYIRYFMWNFAGKEGDIQDMGWESGWNFSESSMAPDYWKNHPSKNHYFALPLLLGLLGLFWHAFKRGDDATVIGLLFFFTGLAIIFYLNQYPAQPRERDYSFAGSFQTFTIWIGLGVIALYQLLEKYLKGNAAILAVVIGLVPPIIMGVENWDDHSRAGRYVAPDSAYNLLQSCAPNAVLFTNGDNDTFPLWYLQEVEGVRTDVRVLCLSYVNTDWYIDQMYQQVNESAPLPLSLEKDKYVGQARQSRNMKAQKTVDFSLPANAQSLLQKGIIDQDEVPFVQTPMSWKVPTRGGGGSRYLELKDVLLLNLLENVAKGGWERPVYFANTVTPSSYIGLAPYLRLEGLAYRILPVKKPTNKDLYDPFEGSLDLDMMFTNMTTKFRYRNLNNDDIYFDENIVRMLSNYHNTFHRLANGYLQSMESAQGNVSRLKNQLSKEPAKADSLQPLISNNEQLATVFKAKATEVMEFTEQNIPYQVAEPDPYIIARGGMMWDRIGNPEKANEYFDFAKNRSLETLKYYGKLGRTFPKNQMYLYPLQMLQQYYSQQGETEKLQALSEEMQQINPRSLR
ncbi:MAG: DUF2723 domain-containing protein [Bacteroidia bacterium]